MAEDRKTDSSRPQLKVRRVSLDTGRENVIVISRHSKALRPDVFRGFSRVELRRIAVWKMEGYSNEEIAERLG